MSRRFLPLLGAALLAGCATENFQDTTDAARRRQILGHWYDQYMQDTRYAQGDTVYRANGTFSATYESVAPGSASEPVRRQTVHWSGKWRIVSGQLIEDITQTSDPASTPADRPMIRYLGRVDAKRLALRNLSGNVNEYARKRPAAPKVSYE